jgi:hypothetical protein
MARMTNRQRVAQIRERKRMLALAAHGHEVAILAPDKTISEPYAELMEKFRDSHPVGAVIAAAEA